MQTWSYKTSIGTFYIVPKGGRFHLLYNNQDLGNYYQPWHISEDLSEGKPANIVSTTGEVLSSVRFLNIPGDLGKWETSRGEG